jgi:2-polyprenyl-3-methyl-5-hydroxy-6-metoxy-1,4-benzoquinol methylase
MDEIQKFYDDLMFPGPYTSKSITEYNQTWDNRYINFIQSCITPNSNVLDIGCGSGLISNVIANSTSCSITAIDWAQGVKFGEKISCQLKLKNVHWRSEDFLKFKTSKKYDVIICQGVLHHIPEWENALKKIKDMLEPNGVLLLGVYHPIGKLMQKFLKFFFKNRTLYIDQIHNPFELTWNKSQVKQICSPLKLVNYIPTSYNLDFLFNGGLTLYQLKST